MTDTAVSIRAGSAPSIDELLARIHEIAQLPIERATAFPPAAYWSSELYELEVERIFRREWMCVARVEQLPEPGSWLAVDLVGEALVLTRDDTGTIHALSRICQHRGQDVLNMEDDRCGTAKRLTCPYHLWGYRLDGQLVSAPEMSRAEGFDRSEITLPSFPVEIWQGFVFVNLDPAAQPLAPRLAPIAELMAPYDLSDWTIGATDSWGELPASWKVAIENGSECYHHIGTHATTLQRMWPASTIVADGGHDDGYFAVPAVVSAEMAAGFSPDGLPIQPEFFPPPPYATSKHRATTWFIGVFPMFFFALSPDFALWFRWLPTGPESHEVDLHFVVPPHVYDLPEAELQNRLQIAQAAVHAIQAEDARNNEGVQRGMRSRHAPQAGRLSHLELPLWQFQRYLATKLAG